METRPRFFRWNRSTPSFCSAGPHRKLKIRVSQPPDCLSGVTVALCRIRDTGQAEFLTHLAAQFVEVERLAEPVDRPAGEFIRQPELVQFPLEQNFLIQLVGN